MLTPFRFALERRECAPNFFSAASFRCSNLSLGTFLSPLTRVVEAVAEFARATWPGSGGQVVFAAPIWTLYPLALSPLRLSGTDRATGVKHCSFETFGVDD